MNCEEACLLISGRIDGSNTQEEEARLDAHLAGCAECCRIWQEFSQIHTDLQGLREEPPEELCGSVMREVRRSTRKKKYRPLWSVLPAAAALALVIGLYGRSVPQPIQTPQNSRSMDIAAASIQPQGTEAAALSMERGTAVAVTHTLLPELENCEAETLADGTQLFRLDNKDGAAELSRAYGLEIYEPGNTAETDCSYVWFVP